MSISSDKLLALYCVLVVAASLAGGWVPMLVRLTHRRVELAISGIAGFMLGVGLLLMLPHALMEARSMQGALYALLAGFLAMFLIERFFSYHHHDVAESDGSDDHPNHGGHVHSHGHTHEHPRHDQPRTHRLTWSGAAVGLTLHSVLDGLALAAAVAAGTIHTGQSPDASLASLGVFLVIFLHRPFDSMTLVTLLTTGGWRRRTGHLVNALFAMAIPLGALLFHLGLSQWQHEQQFIAYALAFSAGTFLCIASSDLLPELQFHSHDRQPLTAALLLGLTLAIVITVFDTHQHDHSLHLPEGSPAGDAGPVHDHSHHDHDHDH